MGVFLKACFVFMLLIFNELFEMLKFDFSLYFYKIILEFYSTNEHNISLKRRICAFFRDQMSKTENLNRVYLENF